MVDKLLCKHNITVCLEHKMLVDRSCSRKMIMNDEEIYHLISLRLMVQHMKPIMVNNPKWIGFVNFFHINSESKTKP